MDLMEDCSDLGKMHSFCIVFVDCSLFMVGLIVSLVQVGWY
jgi:hypothetical protein